MSGLDPAGTHGGSGPVIPKEGEGGKPEVLTWVGGTGRLASRPYLPYDIPYRGERTPGSKVPFYQTLHPEDRGSRTTQVEPRELRGRRNLHDRLITTEHSTLNLDGKANGGPGGSSGPRLGPQFVPVSS